MKGPISPQDQEQLSALLDGQLSAGEQARLEARLQVEPRLRQELAELRNTAQALRGLPQVRAPRNFTLSPKLARRGWSLPSFTFPTLRLATAFATTAFAFVLVLDFNASRQPPPLLSVAATDHERQAAPAPTMVAAAEVAPGATDSQGEGVAALEQAAPENAPTVEQAAPEALATLAQTPLEAAPAATQPGRGQVEAPSFAPDEGDPARVVGGGAGPEATPVSSEKAADAAMATPLPPTPAPVPATQAPAAVVGSTSEAVESLALDAVSAPANPYRSLTVGLAGLAVLLGALTLVVRRFA